MYGTDLLYNLSLINLLLYYLCINYFLEISYLSHFICLATGNQIFLFPRSQVTYISFETNIPWFTFISQDHG